MDWAEISSLTESEALAIVKKYLTAHGFNAERITTNTLPEGQKAPDFHVSDKTSEFLCEVKTPSLKLNKQTGMYHWDTTFNKLRSFIHTASKQFQSYEPLHKHSRVVIFTSNHPQLNWTALHHNIFGAVSFKDQIIRDYRAKKFVIDTSNDIHNTDIYVWMQINYINRSKIYELGMYINENTSLHEQVKYIAHKLVPTKDESIHIPRYEAL